MGRLLAVAVFALAAAGTTLAGMGLFVAPHVDPPGTPRYHDHVFAAYRYSIYLLRLARPLTDGARFDVVAPAAELAGALTLALLAILAPRLPRPTRRVLARLALPSLALPQWDATLALGPPRTTTLRSFA
ncbi:MAG: hypothetical protein HY071_05880 [Chloroflexi bacterium]|nr:hypothetical protein [Chloroflexota bacterium]